MVNGGMTGDTVNGGGDSAAVMADTLWQLACAALEAGDFGGALTFLEARGVRLEAAERAQSLLYAASTLLLYGEAELSSVDDCLREAERLVPTIVATPLFGALKVECAVASASSRAAPSEVEKKAALQVLAQEVQAAGASGEAALARFHAVSALRLAGQYALARAVTPRADELPPHLRWRLLALLAEVAEGLGEPDTALESLRQAAGLAQGPDRAVILQECAAILLGQGHAGAAAQQLEAAWALFPRYKHVALTPPAEALVLATWHYLAAQTDLHTGQPQRALERIKQAAALEARAGEASYGVALVRGQVLSALGRLNEATEAFEAALELALAAQSGPLFSEQMGEGTREGDEEGTEASYARHELAVVLLDLDQPVEAAEHLRAVQGDAAYPFQAEVLADLAEAHARVGELAEARAHAEEALQRGAVVPASLVLGNVALEYYDLSEALAHFQRAASEAPEGSTEWLSAHQLAADVLAQQGFPDPASAYAHAQQALEHTPEDDEWRGPLETHLARAEALLRSGQGRVLN